MTVRSLAPFLRGEGWGVGLSPHAKSSRDLYPFTRIARAIRPLSPQAGRGEERASHAHALELTLRAETPEILRGDRFHRIGGDAETFQRQPGSLGRIRHDIVALEQRDLVRRQL